MKWENRNSYPVNEFDTKEFTKYCIENNIGVNYSEPLEIQKNSIVERFNKTLAGYIKKIREALKIYNWVEYLPELLDNYNHQYHRTIRNTPYDIFYNKGKNKQDILIVPRTFKVNDKVRLRLKKKYLIKEMFYIIVVKFILLWRLVKIIQELKNIYYQTINRIQERIKLK